MCTHVHTFIQSLLVVTVGLFQNLPVWVAYSLWGGEEETGGHCRGDPQIDDVT